MSRSLTRRGMMAASTAAAFHTLALRQGAGFQARPRRVNVRADAEIGLIQPNLHGHFAEHLGSCIYGGLWVGRNSPVPNINGHRKQAVEYLRAVGIPVLRWPGGCFADDYHWRDGVGPAARRPRRVNLWWGQYTEDNSFGTHEFIELCRLIGAEPYLAGNVGSGTPDELRDWTEYCNFPSGSTLADERIANGAREPFRVRFWGVGNENWGCGGRMSPEEYASHYRRFATYLRNGFGEVKNYLIACGPSRNDLDWSRRFLESMTKRMDVLHGFAMHFYSRGKDFAAKFTPESLREQLATFPDMEKAILEQNALLRRYDPQGRIGLLIDEWGVWDRMVPEEEKRYGRLFQQITMRGAVAAALGLNVFHRQADKLVMCNIAQTVNVLHCLLLTDGNHCVRTTTYYAYELLKPHRGKYSVRVENEHEGPNELSVSASRQGRQLIVTLVNPKHDQALRVECSVAGAAPAGAAARIIHHPDFNAANTFEQPDLITPSAHPAALSGSGLTIELPPLSVATVEVRLS